jgi:1,4-dihydroxy-2-naphthoyl-CoA synthase
MAAMNAQTTTLSAVSDALLTRRDGAVLVLSNNNVAARNALTIEFYLGVKAALQAAAADPTVGAVVLTGEGGHFCAGGDLRQLIKRRELPVERAPRAQARRPARPDSRSVRDCRKPVIAAVEGAAAGAGLSLALACDMLVAAREKCGVLGGLCEGGPHARWRRHGLPGRVCVAPAVDRAVPDGRAHQWRTPARAGPRQPPG